MKTSKIKILLIEDDEIDQMAFERMIKKQGLDYDMAISPSISKARTLLESNSFDIVIADYNLSDGTAFDILGSIKDTPVIFATGAGNEEIATKAMRAGAYDYLIKDHSRSYLQVLPMMIDKAIKHSQAEKELDEYHDGLEKLVAERTEELAKEKELLGITMSSMSEAVVALDVDMRIMLFNNVVEQMTGLQFEEVEGNNIEDVLKVINEKTKEPVTNIYEKLFGSNEEEKKENYALVNKKGKECSIACSASVMKADNGSDLGTVLVIRDVTKERKIDQMKTDFISSVSHELRTPLTSIKAFTATILRDPNMPDETRLEFLNIIDEESNRLGSLIEDLLDISRIEAGTISVEFEDVSFKSIFDQTIPALKPLAEKNGIELTFSVPKEIADMQGDQSKIQSVVTNLINNAIKFTPQGGKVHASVEQKGDELVFKVSDTGMGIPKEDIEKLFDKFFRVSRPGTQIQGTGLGLAIVKKVVDVHHGKVDIESELDKGTTFAITFPLAAVSV